MPKKIIFTRDEIIEAAFEIFKKEGIAAISARKIAAKLNSSTAPVYTSFSSMEEIKSILLDKSLQLLLEYAEKEYTHNIFLNIGVGMLEFSKEYRLIYRTLFIESNTYQNILEEFTSKNLLQMKKEKSLEVLSEEDLKDILKKLTVYTHGLASFICADMLEDTSRECFIKNLLDIGGDIIGATALKRGKLEEYLQCYGDGGNGNEKDHRH